MRIEDLGLSQACQENFYGAGFDNLGDFLEFWGDHGGGRSGAVWEPAFSNTCFEEWVKRLVEINCWEWPDDLQWFDFL